MNITRGKAGGLSYVAVNHDPNNKKLLIVLHGLGQGAWQMLSAFQSKKANLKGITLLGLEGEIPGEERSWPGWYAPPFKNSNNVLPNLVHVVRSMNKITDATNEYGKDQFEEFPETHVVGFSQGGTMAIVLGLTYPDWFGSSGNFCGYIPAGWEKLISPDQVDKYGHKLYWSHGINDAENPFSLFDEGAELLDRWNVKVHSGHFEGGHSFPPGRVAQYVNTFVQD